MPRYKVAHIKEQGVDLIIIPLSDSFRFKSNKDKNQITNELQMRASNAGLAGTVVPVWNAGAGRMGFLAPRNWQFFFKSINLQYVYANLNREIYW
ncbi:hypothetical protein [Halanaerobium kushneri]|jgi:hypothetical protein|uniref:Uncharacterized protein n=1 Tax=Halanaerobium kushneri TaxID=56779 RepID=A0A1N6RPC3_9FIRM|nr:hypothetical protein [Halanaerobium kushneri]SIQ30645.1 hypothetical protein SAMN05421834_10366 [Halanaerobium kushneri]